MRSRAIEHIGKCGRCVWVHHNSHPILATAAWCIKLKTLLPQILVGLEAGFEWLRKTMFAKHQTVSTRH